MGRSCDITGSCRCGIDSQICKKDALIVVYFPHSIVNQFGENISQYRVKIVVLTSFKDTCYIEILPTSQESKGGKEFLSL